MTTKNFLSFLSIVTASFILFSCSSTANVANSNSVRVSQAIDTGRWVFNVTSIQPQSGRSQIPNGFYTVSFAPGNLNVYLPYIGQAYGSADLLGGNNPLNFVSKNFEMKKALVKKNKWTIEFKPIDQKQVQSLSFTIFNSGSASLNIIMTDRSPISYQGTVEAK